MSVSWPTTPTRYSPMLANLEETVPHSLDVEITTAEVEKSFDQLLTRLTFTTDRVLDYGDASFKQKFHSLIMDLKPETAPHCEQWEKFDLIDQTESLMLNCQGLLYKIDRILEDQTQYLQATPQARLQRKAELLTDENLVHHRAFHQAFSALTKSYRLIRCKAFSLSLPNIKNFPREKFVSAPLLGDLSKEYCDRFVTGYSHQRTLNTIFNDTLEKLGDLLKTAYPDSPYLAKDEQPIPGDYNNPGNPFRMYPRAPVK